MATTTIDTTIERIDELIEEKSLEEALDYLQEMLRTKKRAGPEELEKLMIKEIDLCVKHLNKRNLKENLSYYRNIMQHENGKTLEKVHKYLRDTIEAKFNQIKSAIKEDVEIEDVDTAPLADDLMLLAFQTEEQWDNKDKLGPCIKFMVESYEMILDVLRQNSTMLVLYNTTAIHCMEFCVNNNRKNEFKRITDTLSKHLRHILTQKPELLKNIPHPIFLEDNACFEKFLELRMKALEFSLKMDNWSDALKITKDIRDIDKYRRTKRYAGLAPPQKAAFLDSIADLFKKAKFHLFFAGALCSADKKYRQWKKRTDQHRSYFADKIILAYLMIPLDDNMCNFKQIGFNILDDSEQTKDKDFQRYTELIEQSTDLRRESILNWIENKNLLTVCSSEVKTLFNLMEPSAIKPAELSKTSEQILQWLSGHKEYSEFLTDIRMNLTLRIFQKLGKVFKVLKYDNFKKLFGFLNFYDCEKAIVEGNRTYLSTKVVGNTSNVALKKRERLFFIKIDPQNRKLTFDAYSDNDLVTNKLRTFIRDIKLVNTQINKTEIVFDNIHEKVTAEMDDIEVRLVGDHDKRQAMKKDMDEQRNRDFLESRLTEAERKAKHEEEKYELEKKMLREGVNREKAEYLKSKIAELVTFLSHEGIKSVNSKQLKDIIPNMEDVDKTYYELKDVVDEINDKKKDEAAKYANKLLNETDYTEKAKRMFEKDRLREQLKERNATEIKDLLNYLETKHANDVKLKHLLINSTESRDIYLKNEMEKREQDLKRRIEEYMKEQTESIKQIIINNAKTKWRKEENKRIMEENKKRLAERDAKMKKEPGYVAPETGEGTFSRSGFGTEKAEISDRPRYDRGDRGDKGERKTYENKGRRDDDAEEGGFNRKAFGRSEAEPARDEERGPKSSGPPKFSSNKPTFGNKGKGADADSWKKSSAKPEDKPKEEEKPKFVRPKKEKKNPDDGVGRFTSGNW